MSVSPAFIVPMLLLNSNVCPIYHPQTWRVLVSSILSIFFGVEPVDSVNVALFEAKEFGLTLSMIDAPVGYTISFVVRFSPAVIVMDVVPPAAST